jgi:predicted membrane protein
MSINTRLAAKDVALIICFTALYAVFAAIPIFRILGMPSQNITAAAITAPIIGILLGPYIGTLSATLGGIISFFAGSFFPPSFVSGIVAALCAGLLHKGKRIWSILLYLSLLIVFGFYPSTGPAWLFPYSLWFQFIGLLILASPLQSMAIKSLKSKNRARFILAFFIISLTSTLAGQISGSLTYMLIFPPPLGGWQALWQGLTLLYPIERTVIALGSAFIGAPLLSVLRSSNLMQVVNREPKQKFP